MKRKLLLAMLCVVGALGLRAQTNVTESYIGDVTWIVNGGGHNHSSSNHKESDGKGWWNTQTLASAWHAFTAPNTSGGAGESWTSGFGSAGVMMGRTMVLPAGNYTLSFDAFACNAGNSVDPATMPSAGDAVAFLTGKDNVDITNTAAAGDASFHNVSFTFDVTTDNTAYEFGIKKLTDGSKIDWCQIKNVTLTLNSADIFPVPNNDVNTFLYSGNQTWHTNTWSTEGQGDGSRFQVPFHELWVASGGKLNDATITGTYTPTQTGVYKVSAWVRAANEAGGDVTGLKIFVGDAETDACTGSSVMSGNGRLGTYAAMADGVSGTPFTYGFKIKDATINWLAFKNVVITYLGSLPEAEVSALISQAEALESQEMNADIKSALINAKNNLTSTGSVANYNALVAAISDAQASADAYALYTPEKTKALALGMTETEIDALAPDVNALKVAEYNFVTGIYSYAVELGTWNASEGTGTMTGQHWDGTTGDNSSSYLEQSSANWNANSWNISYDQDINLPAGQYVFKVAGRQANSDNVTMSLEVKQGNTILGTVSDFPRGDVGLGINTSGETDYTTGEGHTYANNNNGRGWEWRYVQFTLDAPATVNVAVTASATANHMWVGFCNATVQTDDENNVDLMKALVALNDAKAAATLTKNTTNVGTGVFQLDESTNNNLWNAYETAKGNADVYSLTSSSTVSEVNGLVTALTTAISNYNNQALNAPDAGKHYNIIVATTGHAMINNAIVLGREATYPVSQNNYVTNNTGFTLNASAAPNVNLAQACVFTPVEGEANTYYISMEREEGTVYLTYGTLNDSKVNWKDDQIQATTEESKKGKFKIAASATANAFNIYNTIKNNTIACQADGSLYTTSGNADFTLAEASQAEVSVSVAAGKYATRIFPFTPTLPEGVVAYSCENVDGENLTLATVDEPVANVPYILYSENGVETTNLTGWGTAATDSYKVGLLTGVYTESEVPEGSYVLQTQSGVQGFYQVEGSDFTAIPNRAYLTLSSGGSANVRALFFPAAGEATGIEAIGVLTSGNYDGIYTAGGAKVNSLQKGLNIVVKDGKSYKIFVK